MTATLFQITSYEILPEVNHNPSGEIQPMILKWTREELVVFDTLEVPNERRESSYLAVFL